MKYLAWILALAASIATGQTSTPLIWSGTYANDLTTDGVKTNRITLRDPQGTKTWAIEAPGLLAADHTLTLPATAPVVTQVLASTDTLGTLEWANPGVSAATVAAMIAQTSARRFVDLICLSNVPSLSGVQTCDGQLTSSAILVLVAAQTLPSDNGVYQVDDFGAWTNIGAVLPGGLFVVTDQGGGTNYSNSLWMGYGDGGATNNVYQIPRTAISGDLTASRALVTSATSDITTSSTTATELGYVSGVTSAIQTQLSTKTTNPGTTAGDLTYCSNTATPCTSARLGIGSATTVLHGGASAPAYSAVSLTADISGVLPVANGGSNKALTLAAGGILWTDADSFEVGAAGTASDWALSGGTGAPTFSSTTTTAKVVDGSADAIQLRVQGHSTQTSDILVVEKSDGTDLLQVTNTAGTAILGTTTNDSAADGRVGQFIETTITSNVAGSTTAATYTETGANITLSAGDWDVTGCAALQVTCSVGAAGIGAIPELQLYDNTNAASLRQALGGFANAAVGLEIAAICVHYRASVVNGATPSYRLRFAWIANSGSPTVTALTAYGAADYPIYLQARRRR